MPYEPSEHEQAWEERRAKWLTPTQDGKARASEQNVKRLERLLNPKNDAEANAAKPVIAGIVERLGDKHPLKEPMPLKTMVTLLYRNWLSDGTITEDMLKAGRAGTDVDESKGKGTEKVKGI